MCRVSIPHGDGAMLDPDTFPRTRSSCQDHRNRQFLHTSYPSVLTVLHSMDESSKKHVRDPAAPAIALPSFFFFFLIFLVYFYWVWEKGINTVLFWCLTHLPVSSPSLADSIIHLPDTTIVWFIWHMHQKKMSCSEQEHNAVISFPSQTPQQLHSTSHFLLL